jgi:hypothetical protein
MIMFRQYGTNETMSQYLQSLNKQNGDNLQYWISRDSPTMKLRGNSRGKLHEGQGGLSGSSSLRLDGSCDSQAGMLDRVDGSQRQLKGAIRLKSTQIRWFLWWPGREAGLHERWPKDTQSKLNQRWLLGLNPLWSGCSRSSQVGRLEWAVAKDTQKKVGKWLWAAKGPNNTGRVMAQQKESTYSFSGDRGEMLRWCRWWGENHCVVTALCDNNDEKDGDGMGWPLADHNFKELSWTGTKLTLLLLVSTSFNRNCF